MLINPWRQGEKPRSPALPPAWVHSVHFGPDLVLIHTSIFSRYLILILCVLDYAIDHGLADGLRFQVYLLLSMLGLLLPFDRVD